MNASTFIAYAEYEDFWSRFSPLTPYGKDVQSKLVLYTDQSELEQIYDDTEVAAAFLQTIAEDQPRISRISHHLRRLPRFPSQPQEIFDEVELYEIKKFLCNYRMLVSLLPQNICQRFALHYTSQALEAELSLGHQSTEAFFITDEYSPELSCIRNIIRDTDSKIKELRRQQDEHIQRRLQIEFGSREFLIVPKSSRLSWQDPEELVSIEPYDSDNNLVRPKQTAAILALQEQRRELAGRERTQENAVLLRLSAAVNAHLDTLLAYCSQVCRFDLTLARAQLAQEYNLVRPVFVPFATCGATGNVVDTPTGTPTCAPTATPTSATTSAVCAQTANPHNRHSIIVQQGRFLPCEESCRTRGTAYQPLDAEFDYAATVLFGSNMGGKTITLKTLGFLQLCAQTGLFVPAQSFQTHIYRSFHYIGEATDAHTSRQGLSGFGFEIQQFRTAYADFTQPTLALFDEFARTTHSQEAEALISAILNTVVERPWLTTVFSTHFRGVKRLPGVSYMRMLGLNRDKLAARCDTAHDQDNTAHGHATQTSDQDNTAHDQNATAHDHATQTNDQDTKAHGHATPTNDQVNTDPLEQRLRLVDSYMEYVLVRDDGSQSASDAIDIARLLGVATEITARAQEYFAAGPTHATHTNTHATP